MKHRLFAVSILLVVGVVALGLAGCQKQLPRPASTATESADKALTAAAWEETPVPGSTVVSAVTSAPGQATVEVPPLETTPVVLATELPGAAPIATPETPQTQPEPTAASSTGSQNIVHTVQTGETLSGIAALYGVTVQDIVTANRLLDPNQIYPGQKLTIPKLASGTGHPSTGGQCRYYHTVKSGEWVWQIARDYGADPYAILRANNLTVQSATIYAGMVLCIP